MPNSGSAPVTFTLTGRPYSIHLTETTTSTPELSLFTALEELPFTTDCALGQEVTRLLEIEGLSVAKYHGRLGGKIRHDVQDRFMADGFEPAILVAERKGADRQELRASRRDILFGMIFSNAIALAIMPNGLFGRAEVKKV